MREGFVYLETAPDQPGLVRLSLSEQKPALRSKTGVVRYIAHFRDMDTGKMHAHLTLRRALHDIDDSLYRAELADAMAAIEAESIQHERAWIDPEIADADLSRLAQRVQTLRLRHRRLDTVCRYVGIAALILLVLNSL